MTQYLLVAEADRIQDFIFRASYLSGVVGGSQLLTRFCEQIPQLLLGDDKNVIVKGAGKFVALFADKETAYSFGEQLAEAYRQVADGSLTVAQPVSMPTPADFQQALETAEERLREAKQHHFPVTGATPHLPYIAWCGSCGIGLGIIYGKLHPQDETEKPKYLCKACQTKVVERETHIKDSKDDLFLWPFIKLVMGDNPRYFDWTTRPRHVSKYDPRRYVAYLVADGNNTGQIIGAFEQSEKLKIFSEAMKSALRACLAEPTIKIKNQAEIEGHQVPSYPLILGGDDIFALLPAPWALSFAHEFCLAYQKQVGSLVAELKSAPSPTVSATVIICKETYPHTLAYQAGKARLEKAKQLAKVFAYDTGRAVSTVDFAVVTESSMTPQPARGRWRATLGPYFVLPEENPEIASKITRWGLPLHYLLDLHLRLSQQHVPHKHLAKLRQHFDQLATSQEYELWAKELEKLLKRIQQVSSAGQVIQQAVEQLGGTEAGYLRLIKRGQIDKEPWRGHGLPDLLEMWPFAFDLNQQRTAYEE